MDEETHYAFVCQEYEKLKQLHPDWSEDKLYTEAESIVNNKFED